MYKGKHAKKTQPDEQPDRRLTIISVVAVALVGAWVLSRPSASLDDGSPLPSGQTSTTAETTVVETSQASPTVTGTTLQAVTTTAPPVDFYVAPDGDDDGEGTLDDPWRTVTRGIRDLEAGDTLFLREGIYEEKIISDSLNPGTSTAPITVTSFPGEKPIISGLIALTDPDFWVFDNVTVEWNSDIGRKTDHMVKFTGGTGWQIRNSELRNARSFAALLIAESDSGTPTDWVVANNCIHDTIESNDRNQDHLIYVNSGDGDTNGLIERNILWGAPNGSGIKLGGESRSRGGATGVTAQFNTIVATEQSFVVSWLASDNVIDSNLMAIVPEGRSHIRAFELEGTGNTASFNAADIGPLVWADDDYETVLAFAGNQVGVVPQFTRPQDCNGWIASGVLGTEFGHLAADQ